MHILENEAVFIERLNRNVRVKALDVRLFAGFKVFQDMWMSAYSGKLVSRIAGKHVADFCFYSTFFEPKPQISTGRHDREVYDRR